MIQIKKKQVTRINSLIYGYLDEDINNYTDVHTSPNRLTDIALPLELILITLIPHTEPEKKNIHQYANDDVSWQIIGNEKVGLPFGSLSKCLIATIANEVKRTKSPILRLKNVCKKFATIFLVDELTCKKDEVFDYIYSEVLRLLMSRIIFSYNKNGRQYHFNFWWHCTCRIIKNSSYNATLILTKELFSLLLNVEYDIDYKILQKIYASPLQIDIYIWLISVNAKHIDSRLICNYFFLVLTLSLSC